MSKQSSLSGSRLYCPIQIYKDEVFFNLVDYRNSRFASENPDKIIEFYDSFKNRDDLIEWMKERPQGVANIYEVDGDKEIIVVIPTADFNGKYAKECRENIFKGLHIVFVESGGREDFYFNYAHNCNIGIRKAMEYNPKWIILSGDDTYKIDEASVLINELSEIDPNNVKTVFTKDSDSLYHSYKAYISKKNVLSEYLTLVYFRLFKEKSVYKNLTLLHIINKKFKNKWEMHDEYGHMLHNIIKLLENRRSIHYIQTASFTILSAKWCLEINGIIFDETYTLHYEDVELSIMLNQYKEDYTFINYKIGCIIGGTLGTKWDRTLRAITGCTYFNWKKDSGALHDKVHHLTNQEKSLI